MVTLVAVGVITAVLQSPVGEVLHDNVREMVCLVDGPECGGETWTEIQRPEEPEEYVFTFPIGYYNGPVIGEGDARVAIEWALSKQGLPYVWGGTGPHGYDCSGLVQGAWRAAGVQIPRTTWEQRAALPPVSRDQLQPGDLIFFHTMSNYPPPTHVGMYIGDGKMVHAGNPVNVTQVFGNPYWESRWVSAARVPQRSG
ncbi:cell wall-associated hydrolase (invasion-associated proteins) [Thermobifida fusca TM51]|uniref:Cell wall-associated hydrolase (Invasion-associated proteins) n=1 Tax=Thermobifida fusca TM51 TaxID=1169414 RepID=A0A9P2T9C8_THEFU|nr:cell wall-associated hydrolase (invasion-associated proteins) [Thermobifida fusca TM51]